jgi:archaellum component FlaG (FlaF/FlaG flagellin family)
MILTTGINNSYADEQSLLSTTGTESEPCANISIEDVTVKLISSTLNDTNAAQPEDTVLIQGIVANIGTKDCLSDFVVQVLWGTTTIATKSVSGLPAGGTVTIEVEKTYLCQQAQEITIECNGGVEQENVATSSTFFVDEFILHGNLLPDLVVSDISLSGHYVHLTIENKGQGIVASGKTAVHVFIDGKMQGGLGSSYFDSLTFRRPGGRKVINTGFSVSGTHTIMAVIDSEPFNIISESDEENNTATATIIAPSSTRDLIITDIDYDSELGIVPVASNQGSISYAPGTIFKVNVRVNKQQVSRYTYTLDAMLNPKTTIRLLPPAPIKINRISRVLVHVEPIHENLDDENINNIMEKKIQP